MTALPPGPSGRIRTTYGVLTDAHGFFASCRATYGDTFTLDAMNGRIVVSCDPVFASDLYALKSDRHRPFAVDATTPLLGASSMLLLHGEAHRRERRLLTPPFHGARMRAYGGIIQAIAAERAATWSPGAALRAMDELLDVSIQVIIRAVFGVQGSDAVARWGNAVSELVAGINPAFLFFPALQRAPFGLGPWGRFTVARGRLDALIYAEIGARRASGERGEDILSLMLDATYEDGGGMTDAAIRDELVTLLFAGHETTQITMAWALYRLHERPEALGTLRAELDGAGDDPAQIAKLPYLGAVCDETLRRDVVVTDVLRTLTQDATLGGVPLPAGTNVGLAITTIHHREDLFEQPSRWLPERFIGKTYGPSVFMPFGGGTRRCIGAALANYEMRLVLASWVRDHRFERDGDEVVVRRNATVGPKHGVKMRYLGPRSGSISPASA